MGNNEFKTLIINKMEDNRIKTEMNDELIHYFAEIVKQCIENKDIDKASKFFGFYINVLICNHITKDDYKLLSEYDSNILNIIKK